MLLRSGNTYDPELPRRRREFCHFGNLEFCRIWDAVVDAFQGVTWTHEIDKLFRREVLSRVDALLQSDSLS